MKSSYLRSKVQLKPIDNSQFGSKKTIIDYQKYQQQLSQYQKKNKNNGIANLFDWTKPSQIISLQSKNPSSILIKQPEHIQNNSLNTEELLRSDKDASDRHSIDSGDLDDSIEVELHSKDENKLTYAQQIVNDYAQKYKNIGTSQLEKQLKQMRQRIIDMNSQLNKMLDRYQLLSGRSESKQVRISDPYKFLSKQKDLNCKILQKQQYQIASLNQRDKDLQKKDYLVELNDMILQIAKEIHDMGHQKHNQWVDTERIDKLLKQIQSIQASDDQFRSLRQLKIKIVFYFKKLKQRKTYQEQLDQQLQKLIEKEKTITNLFENHKKTAISRCLQVSTNKQFIQLKRKYEQLTATVESETKKKQILAKSFKIAEQKIQKQMHAMTKQLQNVQMQTQQIQYKSITIDQQTKKIMEKNKINSTGLKSISYRFDSHLIDPERSSRYKPDFKRISRIQGDENNRTIDVPRKYTSTNDKNMTVQDASDNAENSSYNNRNSINIKPILKSVRQKMDNSRYSVDISKQKYKTLQTPNIFKPNFGLKLKR